MQALFVSVVVLVLLALVRLGTLSVGAAVVVVAALVVLNLIATRRVAALRGSSPAPAHEAVAGPLAACWLALSLVPIHNFVLRSNTQAVSELGVEPMIELTYFLVVGAYAVVVIGRLEPGLRAARPPVLLFLLPAWVLASSTWSSTGPYAAARGVQFAVIALVAWATLAMARVSGPHLMELVSTYLRWFVRVAVALVVVGAAFGPIFVPAAGANLERFTWIGAHPNGAGLIVAAAIVIAVTAPLSALRASPVGRAAIVAVLAAAMYGNHSRTAWLGLAFALLLAFGFAGRLRPLVRWLGAPLLALVGYGSFLLWGDRIWEYILRDQDSETLATGHGRLGLWSAGFDALRTPFDWLCGLGYGTARTLFLPEGEWARSAHNSILSWLVSNGLIAVGLVIAVLVLVLRDLVRVKIIAAEPLGLALVGLLSVLCVNGLAADTMAEPALGFVGVYLVTAVSIGLAEQRRPAVTGHRGAAAIGPIPSRGSTAR